VPRGVDCCKVACDLVLLIRRDGGAQLSSKDDDRITDVGRWIAESNVQQQTGYRAAGPQEKRCCLGRIMIWRS
jgi:hypothetical protein